MKRLQSKNPNQNIRFNTNKHRPENKDDIDSREGEEQLIKGDDVTHNKKEHESSRKKVGNKKK
jgi:hypothetical protein